MDASSPWSELKIIIDEPAALHDSAGLILASIRTLTSSGAAFAEREYNLRAAFPDHPQWFARWAADSERVRASMRMVRDVRYGAGPKQIVDLFPAERPRGALLFIHGGYWRALDKDDHSFIARPFVGEGIGVAVVSYDLCPDVRITDIANSVGRPSSG